MTILPLRRPQPEPAEMTERQQWRAARAAIDAEEAEQGPAFMNAVKDAEVAILQAEAALAAARADFAGKQHQWSCWSSAIAQRRSMYRKFLADSDPPQILAALGVIDRQIANIRKGAFIGDQMPSGKTTDGRPLTIRNPDAVTTTAALASAKAAKREIAKLADEDLSEDELTARIEAILAKVKKPRGYPGISDACSKGE